MPTRDEIDTPLHVIAHALMPSKARMVVIGTDSEALAIARTVMYALREANLEIVERRK